MAIVGTNNPTLQDVASRTENRKIADIVEILNETNEILTDMTWMEGNLATGHKSTIRSGLPTVTWRLLNYGVPNSKGKTVQVTDTVGMLEAYSEVDKSLADLNSNAAAFRLSEADSFLESMSQTMASTIFYGNTDTDPEKFMGLAPRYNSLSAENAANVVTGDGTGSDNTSIWLITWHPQTCFGIYPKGSPAGLQHMDKGQQTLQDAAGQNYEGYRDHFKWDAGMVLKDWRYVVRIANIDVSNLTKNAATGSDIITLMIKAVHKLKSRKGRQVFYANETIYTYLDLQTYNSSNLNVMYGKDVHGQEVLMFRGIPVRKCDAILDTEATIS